MGFPKEAVWVFLEMGEESLRADEVALVIVHYAFSKIGNLDLCGKVRSYI